MKAFLLSGCENIGPWGLLKACFPVAQLVNVHPVVSTHSGLMATGDLSLDDLAC